MKANILHSKISCVSYTLRIPEGIRNQIKDLVRRLPPEVLTEWTRRVQALCDKPRLATPLPRAVLPEAFNYSFQIGSYVFVYGLDINDGAQTIDVLDFRHGRVL